MPLSERLRPGVEAPEWVIKEVEILEAFYNLTVKERDYIRRQLTEVEAENRRLKSQLNDAFAEICKQVHGSKVVFDREIVDKAKEHNAQI